MAKILIELDTRTGIRKSTSRVNSISEANEAGNTSARISFALSCLHDAALEAAGLPGASREFGQNIWVPRIVDPELGADNFEQLELGLAEAPRPFHERPADWVAAAVKKAYPSHFAWPSVGDEYAWEKDGKTFRGGETETDVALFILTNAHGANGRNEHRFLNESCLGWIDDEKKGTVLVTDMYEMSEATLAAVQTFAYESGLRFSINGTSSSYPSKAFRLSLYKA